MFVYVCVCVDFVRSKLNFILRSPSKSAVLTHLDPRHPQATIDNCPLTEERLQKVLAVDTDVSPSCAIMGGVLGQEMLKVTSGRDKPLQNHVSFATLEGLALETNIH